MKLNIVIADDDSRIHDSVDNVIKRYITQHELRFNHVYTTADLMDYLRYTKDKVNLLILDNDFGSGLTGIETLPHIRKQLPVSPILLLTAEDKVSTIDRATQYSVDYVLKPIGDAEIVHRIKTLILRVEKWEQKVSYYTNRLEEIKKGAIEHDIRETEMIRVLLEYTKEMECSSITDMPYLQSVYRKRKKTVTLTKVSRRRHSFCNSWAQRKAISC